jgi:DNA-binding NarL/FixJ family response regulator
MLKDTQNYNLAVIEDNEGDFFLLQEYLSEKNNKITITRFVRFSDFDSYIQNQPKSVDVVILDLSLPDKNGLELVQSVLEKSPNTPVIVLTGYSDVKVAEKSIDLGVSLYLLKDEIDSESLYNSLTLTLGTQEIL